MMYLSKTFVQIGLIKQDKPRPDQSDKTLVGPRSEKTCLRGIR